VVPKNAETTRNSIPGKRVLKMPNGMVTSDNWDFTPESALLSWRKIAIVLVDPDG
jgi:hypothetical protein